MAPCAYRAPVGLGWPLMATFRWKSLQWLSQKWLPRVVGSQTVPPG